MCLFSAFFTTIVMNIFDGGRIDSDKEFSKCGCIMEIVLLFFFGIFLIISFILDVITYPIQVLIKYSIKCCSKKEAKQSTRNSSISTNDPISTNV